MHKLIESNKRQSNDNSNLRNEYDNALKHYAMKVYKVSLTEKLH